MRVVKYHLEKFKFWLIFGRTLRPPFPRRPCRICVSRVRLRIALPSLGTFQRFLDIGTANGNRGFYAGQSLFATRFPALHPIAFTKPPQFRGDYFGFSDRPPMQGLLARLDGRTARARRSGVRIRKGECRHPYPITWRGICGDVACADRATTAAPRPRGA